MKPLDVKYCFSPTLLDSFQSLLDFEESWERFYGDESRWEDGEPKKSLEEWEKECFQSTIDAINHVPFTSEACSKGTAWNDLVDTLVHKTKCGRTNITRKTDENGKVIAAHCEVDGFAFDFDINDAIEAAEYFKDSLSQLYVHSYIDTKYGIVNLFGYLDELRRDVVYDIKTTKKYDFGNYFYKWQKHLYPYCLIESGQCKDISEFEYTIFELKGGGPRQPIITTSLFTEVYVYFHEASRRLLRGHCEEFIEFIEKNKELITNQNIFKEHERKLQGR